MLSRRAAAGPVPVEQPELEDKLIYQKLAHGKYSLRRRTEGDVLKARSQRDVMPAPFAATMARNMDTDLDPSVGTSDTRDTLPVTQTPAVIRETALTRVPPPSTVATSKVRSNSLFVGSQQPSFTVSANSVVLQPAECVRQEKPAETKKPAASVDTVQPADAKPAGVTRSNSDEPVTQVPGVTVEGEQWAVGRRPQHKAVAALAEVRPTRAQSLPDQLHEHDLRRGSRGKIINDIKSEGRQRLLSIAADNTLKMRGETYAAQLMAEEKARREREEKEEKRLRLLRLLKQRGQLPPKDDVMGDVRAQSTSQPSLSRNYEALEEVQMLQVALLHWKLADQALPKGS